jgi:hypothetical protein
MQDFNLRQLDQRTIAVELITQEEKRMLKGVGQFDVGAEMGPCLRIIVSDPAGDFEILLKESQWSGQITLGEQFGCDFALRLDAASLCRDQPGP